MTINRKGLKCPVCKNKAGFIFDDDDPDIKDKPLFMLATIHGNPPRVLIATFDKEFKVRRTKCLPLQMYEEEMDID